jgi:hypothetical protein
MTSSDTAENTSMKTKVPKKSSATKRSLPAAVDQLTSSCKKSKTAPSGCKFLLASSESSDKDSATSKSAAVVPQTIEASLLRTSKCLQMGLDLAHTPQPLMQVFKQTTSTSFQVLKYMHNTADYTKLASCNSGLHSSGKKQSFCDN